MGKADLIGEVGTLIYMVDPQEGEDSVWIMEDNPPTLHSIA